MLVGVSVFVGVGVLVGVSVFVGVGVLVGVSVFVGVGVLVGVSVTVRVGASAIGCGVWFSIIARFYHILSVRILLIMRSRRDTEPHARHCLGRPV